MTIRPPQHLIVPKRLPPPHPNFLKVRQQGRQTVNQTVLASPSIETSPSEPTVFVALDVQGGVLAHVDGRKRRLLHRGGNPSRDAECRE